jgi:serine/threonine protein kinase
MNKMGERPHSVTLPSGYVIENFEITKVIGVGGFGIVYEAEDQLLGRKVAIKEFMPSSMVTRLPNLSIQLKSERHEDLFKEALTSFIAEARLLASFDHPSLVKVHRYWEQHGTAYIVMPFYDGLTLKSIRQALSKAPNEDWLKRILGQAIDALSVLHAKKIYHRDIAPDNILLTKEDRRAVLLDFGAARKIIEDKQGGSEAIILKLGYAPLEQYEDDLGLKQGSWTDVYALAATIHFLIFGSPPPPSPDRLNKEDFDLFAKVKNQYSDGFLSVLRKALEVDPRKRTQTLSEFRENMGIPAGAGELTLSRSTPKFSFDVSKFSILMGEGSNNRPVGGAIRRTKPTKNNTLKTKQEKKADLLVILGVLLSYLFIVVILRYGSIF